MTRADILKTAEKCVCGKREQDYGKPENNFQAIADLWNAYWTNVLLTENRHGVARITNRPFSSFDVAMFMALLKVGRIATGTATEDSFVDACGYLACGGEIIGNTRYTLDELNCCTDIRDNNRCPGSGAKQY